MSLCLKINLRQKRYTFSLKIGFLFVCLFFMVLFIFLGSWQIHRYHYKKDLLNSYHQHHETNPKHFRTAVKQVSDFQHINVEGNYLNELTMLIQNRPYKGKIGFEVLTPLQIPGESKLLLINRGWIPSLEGSTAPPIPKIEGKQTLKGYIKFNEHQFILGQNIYYPNAKPLIIQKIDYPEISRILGQDFYPFLLRLDPGEPHGFVRDWIISTMPPERHMGYAVQWFVLALMVIIAYIGFCYEYREDVK